MVNVGDLGRFGERRAWRGLRASVEGGRVMGLEEASEGVEWRSGGG